MVGYLSSLQDAWPSLGPHLDSTCGIYLEPTMALAFQAGPGLKVHL